MEGERHLSRTARKTDYGSYCMEVTSGAFFGSGVELPICAMPLILGELELSCCSGFADMNPKWNGKLLWADQNLLKQFGNARCRASGAMI